jgi:hypothetical protein
LFSRISPGTDVIILEKFLTKNFAKILAFITQNKAILCEDLIVTLVFEKNAIFFAKNWEKSQKIVIVTSTPGVYFGQGDQIGRIFAQWMVLYLGQ